MADAALALAIMVSPAVFAMGSAQAQTYTYRVLYSFSGAADGGSPSAGLVLDAQGNLYGTAQAGGYPCPFAPFCGTVFKVDTTSKETVLYSFTGTEGDGADPMAGLVLDAQGNLYGTTVEGGGSGSAVKWGTVFKLDTAGMETVLYRFTGPDGNGPMAGLVLDAQGNLYGTTAYGGDRACNGTDGCGTVFKVDTAGTETVIHVFTGTGGDGAYPYGGLVLDPQGNLYGTTQEGGAYVRGTVFKVDTTGKETVLHSFEGGADGWYPYGGLVLDPRGNLYGTTQFGGGPSNDGTVFKVDPAGTETVLHSFNGTSGSGPYAGLVLDGRGNLYGTTRFGGDLACNPPYGCGTVFKLDTTGKETVLHSFTGTKDGEQPYAGLALDGQGNLYGTTWLGGAYDQGTVFKLRLATKTTTTLESSPSPSTYGQTVIFTAEVTSKLGAPPDGETVSFSKGTTALGSGVLSGGSASFTTSTLKVGTNAIKAVYGGDATFADSTSKAVSQVVGKATTTTVLTSSVNPSKVGQSVTFTASVTPQFSGAVNRNVTLYDGTMLLKTVALSGGAAKYTTSQLTSGTHSITATYNGSTDFETSTSPVLTQTVN